MGTPEERQDLISQPGSTPEADRAATTRIHRIAAQIEHTYESYGGDLPPPEHIAALEALMPGATNRLFVIAEQEQAHRHQTDLIQLELLRVKQEKTGEIIRHNATANQSDAQRSLLSLLAATVVVLATLGIYAYSLAIGKHSDASFALLVGELATLAGAFIYSANKKAPKQARKQTRKDEADEDETQIEDAE